MFRTSPPFVPGIQPQYRPFGRTGGGGGDYRVGLDAEYYGDNAPSGSVTTWANSGDNGIDLSSTGATSPTKVTNVINGHSVVRWGSGASTVMDAAFNRAGAETYFIVMKFTASSTQVFTDGSSGGTFREIYASGSGLNIYSGTNLSCGTMDGAFHLLSVVFNGASSGLWLDGTSQGSGNAGTDGRTGFRVGQANGGSFGMGDADFAVVRDYDHALTTGNRQTVEDFLGAMFAITITH